MSDTEKELELEHCKKLLSEWLREAYSLKTIDHIIDLVNATEKILGRVGEDE